MSRHLLLWLVFALAAVSSAALSSAALADPPGQIAGGKASTTVPFLLVQNHILVSVSVNGKGPFLFLLDTGAESNALDTTLVRSLNLKTKGEVQINGTGPQSVPAAQTENSTVQVGDATIPDQNFITYDFSDLRKLSSTAVVGALGRDVFRDFVVKIDYGTSNLVLTLPSQFVYQGTGTVLPLSFSQHHIPQIDGDMDGFKGKFNIDTGYNNPLLLYAPFVQKNSLRAKYAARSQASDFVGAGGSAKTQIIPALPFRFGGFSLTVGVGMLEESGGATSRQDAAGQIGNQLLSYFNPTFDYSHNRVIFEQPSHPAQSAPAQATVK